MTTIARRGSRWRESLAGDAFLIPILLVFIIIILVPFVQSVYYSFTDYNGISPDTRFVGLGNYSTVFTDPSLLTALGFTLVFAIGTTLLITVFAIPLSLILNRTFFGKKFVRAMFFFPAIPSVAILGFVWGFILNPLGSGGLNSVLQSLFHIAPVPWLADGTLAQICTILVGVWISTGWHSILYLAYLQSIPEDYYEVATIDGASKRQQFFYITLPLLTPAITISTLLLMIGGLNVYALTVALTGGGPGFSTQTITQSIITQGIAGGRYGQASALSVVFMIAVGLIVVTQLVITRRLERTSA
jgi:raffinose/stachyose/melibiose transport system permease protein